MTFIKGQVIRLEPNNKQVTYLAKACGVARFAYNWALSEWKRQYEEDKAYRDECEKLGISVDDSKLNKPNKFKLNKQFNSIKKEQYPFVLEVTQRSPEKAILHLGNAFDNFFKGRAKYPQFRKKGMNDSFCLANNSFRIQDNKVFIQKLGWVRMSQELRLKGKILSGKVFKTGKGWFISINVELDEVITPLKKTGKSVGIDLGVKHLMTLSDGTKIEAPKPLKSQLKKLRRLSKNLSKKVKGSSNREKAKTKLSRLHAKISNIRKDFNHKLTTQLVKSYDVIAIEDLNVKEMYMNRRFNRAINDLGFYEIKRQLIYKANQWGKTIKSVDRFYPSSKTCSVCSFKNDNLSLKDRSWVCSECHTEHDRDINASVNILANADKVLTVV